MKFRNETNVELVRHTTRANAVCSVGRAPFKAIVKIEYEPCNWLLEFIAYEEWLRKFASIGTTTIEELCDNVFDHLWEELEPEYLSVEVRGITKVHSPAFAQRKEWTE